MTDIELPTNDPTNPLHRLADDLQEGRIKDLAVSADVDYALREISRLRVSAREAAAEIEEARKLLRRAEQFIANGIELGFIRMPEPDCPDPAHATLPLIRAFLANPPQPQKGEGG